MADIRLEPTSDPPVLTNDAALALARLVLALRDAASTAIEPHTCEPRVA